MKCPKCGYLGFETTDRCRNCQYDFSLAPVTTEPELALQSAERVEGPGDFDLPSIKRPADTLTPSKLDLDRLFGDAEPSDNPVALKEEPAGALPFDDVPIVPPPAARPPLAVRRATSEVPRNRPRTTRSIKPESLQLEPETTPRISAAETVALLMETPP